MTAVTLAKRRTVIRSPLLVSRLILVYFHTNGDSILIFRHGCIITGYKV
nr:hypothetical protein [Salinimicrobium marinum]